MSTVFNDMYLFSLGNNSGNVLFKFSEIGFKNKPTLTNAVESVETPCKRSTVGVMWNFSYSLE